MLILWILACSDSLPPLSVFLLWVSQSLPRASGIGSLLLNTVGDPQHPWRSCPWNWGLRVKTRHTCDKHTIRGGSIWPSVQRNALGTSKIAAGVGGLLEELGPERWVGDIIWWSVKNIGFGVKGLRLLATYMTLGKLISLLWLSAFWSVKWGVWTRYLQGPLQF